MNTEIKETERWVTIKEVCVHLGISRYTLNTWITKLKMPAHKIGGCWRFKISEVDKWIESQTVNEQCENS